MDVLKVVLSNRKTILAIKNIIFIIIEFSETLVNLSIVKNISVMRLVGFKLYMTTL